LTFAIIPPEKRKRPDCGSRSVNARYEMVIVVACQARTLHPPPLFAQIAQHIQHSAAHGRMNMVENHCLKT
jgi:hypothetical protein